jgi:histidinol phosphatase-like PHP family hydrolase
MGTDTVINLHTHTLFSDGDFTPEQIVASAVHGHLTHIAITDHFETSKVRSLLKADFDHYLSRIHHLKDEHDDIAVLAGVELDTDRSRCDLEALPIDMLNQLDLVLLECVGDRNGSTLEELEPLLSRLEPPCILVHNDIERNYARLRPEVLAEHFASHQVGVEINTAWPYKRDGLPYYVRAESYYRAFKNKVRVSVGTDVHHSLAEVYNLAAPYRFLQRTGLVEDTLF